MTVVRLFQVDRWEVAVDLEQPVVVEPVDPPSVAASTWSTVRQGPRRRISSVLNRPITDSASGSAQAATRVRALSPSVGAVRASWLGTVTHVHSVEGAIAWSTYAWVAPG